MARFTVVTCTGTRWRLSTNTGNERTSVIVPRTEFGSQPGRVGRLGPRMPAVYTGRAVRQESGPGKSTEGLTGPHTTLLFQCGHSRRKECVRVRSVGRARVTEARGWQ